MAKNNNNMKIMIGVLVFLLLIAVWCLWNNRNDTEKKEPAQSESFVNTANNDIELIEPDDGTQAEHDMELLDCPDETDCSGENVGFGMGPGLYGSGRAFNEFYGA